MVRGTLKAYHRQGAYQAGKGYAYSGGDLNIVTPLLTGDQCVHGLHGGRQPDAASAAGRGGCPASRRAGRS